ncbi:unnamed protein product [Ceutorhynchus assimilis]|uniref:Uncharacterized protein n=1 Tax=Ceutorhynchus assimilis TaxID=467358 RepID=A0A9N9MQU4_9CUCU|nr:unnamed protein product [Ceutorhynchus assimilis]
MNGDDGFDWLSESEQQFSRTIENQQNCDDDLAQENETFQQRVWSSFQESATAVAQLYRERYTGEPGKIWLQFQTAAGTVTTLYKESCENLKKTTELARQSGHQKRNSELLNWAKRKRRLIKREELLAFLADAQTPQHQGHLPQYHPLHHTQPYHRSSPNRRNQTPPLLHRESSISPPYPIDPNLHTFREALANSRRGCTPPHHPGADLGTFIAGEVARHGFKRSSSPTDVSMGSPTHQKRPRYM